MCLQVAVIYMIQILNIRHGSQRRILPLFLKNTSVGSYLTINLVTYVKVIQFHLLTACSHRIWTTLF